jgi:hypothetical protein
MPNFSIRKPNPKKPTLSLHQKQIQFMTRLSVAIALLLGAALLWLVNRTSLNHP